jgi:hypothetical protein
MCSLFVF